MRAHSFLKYLRHPSFIFRRGNPNREEVDRFVKKIYSPDSFANKPRFKKRMSQREIRKIEKSVRRVYNP